LGGRGTQISEFVASLVYKVSSRTARAIQRNPVSKKKKTKNKQTNKQTKNKKEEEEKEGGGGQNTHGRSYRDKVWSRD
jgi:ribosomal protein L12E/L44/L45/RPP1/RPP2